MSIHETHEYERTENGAVTRVSVREAMNEVNDAMMGSRHQVREMSGGNGQHSITYRDGRTVKLVLVPKATEVPAETEHERTPFGRRIVTVKGNRYAVSNIFRKGDYGTYRVAADNVSYWPVRDGREFGATRQASEDSRPGTVASLVWAAVEQGGI